MLEYEGWEQVFEFSGEELFYAGEGEFIEVASGGVGVVWLIMWSWEGRGGRGLNG